MIQAVVFGVSTGGPNALAEAEDGGLPDPNAMDRRSSVSVRENPAMAPWKSCASRSRRVTP